MLCWWVPGLGVEAFGTELTLSSGSVSLLSSLVGDALVVDLIVSTG